MFFLFSKKNLLIYCIIHLQLFSPIVILYYTIKQNNHKGSLDLNKDI
jgi:hypothetical protein